MSEDKKVTIYDIANELGISVGTVYRALHNTGRINADTKQRVLDTAEKMGFQANPAAQSLRRNPIYIGVILCCPVKQYLDEIKRGMDAVFDQLRPYHVYSDIRTLYGENAETNSYEINAMLDEFVEKSVKGVVLFLSGDNRGYRSTIERLEQKGIPVATVANDIEGSRRVISVSADGQCAGQLAAEILYLCCPNKRVAILTGSNDTAIHKENLIGFMKYTDGHPFSAIDVYEHKDQPDLVVHQINEILKAEDPYRGLYITSASSICACQYIWKTGLKGKIKIITTDLFQENKELLRNETACATIFQDPYRQGKMVIQQIYGYINKEDTAELTLLKPIAIFRSNMNMF
ncbi:MAG: LacI family DNA-binding transcriptional regulator [Clostridiaceae bacterium]|nr:LacI family DNA-binding transcriptional regulator [Clostridiaceae bacterium]